MSSTGLLPIVYQLDTTGVNRNNKVLYEPHQLETRRIRALSPLHAPFFATSVIIKDSLTNATVPRTSYKFFNLQALASAMYGKEIYTIILITDPNVSDNVKVTYQTLGGEYTRIYDSTVDLINILNSDNRPAAWPNITNKPESFAPNLHLHAVGDTIGFEYVVSALERLRNTMLVASNLRADDVLAYLESRLTDLNNTNIDLMGSIDAMNTSAVEFGLHVGDINNPHRTTKAQVGLSNVENHYPTTNINDLSTPSSSNPKYVTNVILRDYMNQVFASFNDQIDSKFTTVQSAYNLLNTKLQELESLTGDLFNVQTTTNLLNVNYTELYTRMNAAEANMANAPIRANGIINQYLNSLT